MNSNSDFWIQLGIDLLNFFSFFYDVTTFPVYFLLHRPWKVMKQAQKMKSVVVSSDDTSITIRNLDGPAKLHKQLLVNNIDTMEKAFKFATKLNTTKKCIGTRQILAEDDEVQDDGSVHKKYRLGSYVWLNFNETELKAKEFGRGLREVGVKPKDRVVIFAETRAEWLIAAHGLFKHSCAIVTIYATLGEEGIIHGISETEVDTVITSHELLPKVKKVLKSLPQVRRIIYFEDQMHLTDTKGFGDIKINSFSQIVHIGSKSQIEEVPPTKDDIAIIMYTSGSTGIPKGVILTHDNCTYCMKTASDRFPVYKSDIYMAFLPLAHVFEMMAETVASIVGVPIGYSSALTLLDTSPKIMKGCQGDASVLKPTCMTSVPLILERISKGIVDKIRNGNYIQKVMFKFAYEYKRKWVQRGYKTPIIDAVVFKKVANLLGGKVRLMVCGGAPLPAETQERIHLCFSMILHQGYGLTETTAGATLTDRFELGYGHVGTPMGGFDIRLINWEEGNYRVTNKPHPQGEIIVGGGNVAIGYFKHPEKTAEEFFDEDGKRWFKTGDIGELLPDGNVKIIDRRKDLIKLAHGEYVSLGKVEAEIKTSSLVDNICVYADPEKTYVVALVSPNEKNLVELALSIGIEENFKDLCENSKITLKLEEVFREILRNCGFAKYEIPKRITLCKEIWTPDSGLVTAAFKIRRKQIQERYQDDITRMYSVKH